MHAWDIDVEWFHRAALTLGSGKEWTGAYCTDFQTLLRATDAADEGGSLEDGEQDEVRYSLVSRTLREDHKQRKEQPESTSRELAPRNMSTQIVEAVGHAAMVAQGRSWRGLEVKLGQTEVCDAVEGRHGVAMGYQEEGSERKRESIVIEYDD